MRFKAASRILVGGSWLVASAAVAQSLPANTASLASSDADAGQGGPEGLQDIVVTAQRREESLQKVPVAVTAVTAQQLTDLRVTSIRNLSVLAPGLQINTQGRQTVPTVNIRGISSGSTIASVDPKVGIYVDGVYVGRVVGSVFEVADIERVEVLRGPQGTLFGRNATGGAISIITAAPTGKFGVKGTVSYGNYDAKRAKVSVNLPQFGPFSARISYLHDEIDGDVRNLLGGETLDFSRRYAPFGTFRIANKLGGRNTDGVLVSLRGEFGAVQMDYRFDYTDGRSVGRAQQSYGVLPADQVGQIVAPIIALQSQFGGFTNVSTSPLDPVANATAMDHVKTQGHSLTFSVDATDFLTLKSITAYRKMNQMPSLYDLSATGGLRFTRAQLAGLITPGLTAAQRAAIIFNPANLPGPNDHFFGIFSAFANRQQQVSQEFQASISTDPFDLIAGAFYFHEANKSVSSAASLATFDDGVYIPTTPVDRSLTRVNTNNNAFAFYAQGTAHVTEQIDLTGGIRYSIDDRGSNVLELSGATLGALGVGNFRTSFSRVNYTAIATWRPTDRITTYAKVSTGYVAGGVTNGSRFDPEDLTAYELGLKTQLFDNRLRANFAVYQSNYKNLQTQVFANGVSTLTNAGKARIRGIEAEIEFVPVRGLTISANGTLTDFKYLEYFLGGREVSAIAKPPFVSKYTGRVSVGYVGPEFGNGSHGIFRVDASYRSKVQLGPLAVLNPNGSIADVDKYNSAKGYVLVDGRIGIGGIELGGSKISVTAFGANLLDKKYTSYGVNVASIVRGIERGRTYGIEVGFDF